jgi:hypothetical protein
LPAPKNIRFETGSIVKQIGRFQFRSYTMYVDDQEIVTNSYVVALENEDGSYEELGLIKSDKSTLSGLLDYLHNWQHARYNDMYVMKRVQARAESEEAKAHHKSGLDAWERQYLRVDCAIRELEPDYQPDESIYESHQAPTEDNKGESHFE